MYEFGEAEGQLLTLLVFMLFGAMLLPEALASVSLRDCMYAALSLTIIGMLPVALN